MEESPLISYVVTTYNSEEYIEDNIRSIKKQNFNNQEIIITDQCSKDQTRQIVEETENVTLLKTDNPNAPPTKVFNNGLREAEGDIIILLDDDIELEEGFTSSILEAFENEDSKTAIIQPKIIEENRTKFKEHEEIVRMRGCAYAAKKELYKDIGYLDENFDIYRDDYEYSTRAVANGYKVKTCPDAIARHKTEVSGSQSGRELKNNTRNQLWIAWKYYPLKNAILSTFYRPARNTLIGLEQNQIRAVITGFVQSWTKFPKYAIKERKSCSKCRNRDWSIKEIMGSVKNGVKRI